jgi:hypothetical protein
MHTILAITAVSRSERRPSALLRIRRRTTRRANGCKTRVRSPVSHPGLCARPKRTVAGSPVHSFLQALDVCRHFTAAGLLMAITSPVVRSRTANAERGPRHQVVHRNSLLP